MSRRASRHHAGTPHGESSVHGTGHRQERLEHILRVELEYLLRDEVSDRALEDVQITSVVLSPDGGHARIGYTATWPEQEALKRATGFLRARLASQLDLKRTPKLSFVFIGTEVTGGEPCLE